VTGNLLPWISHPRPAGGLALCKRAVHLGVHSNLVMDNTAQSVPVTLPQKQTSRIHRRTSLLKSVSLKQHLAVQEEQMWDT